MNFFSINLLLGTSFSRPDKIVSNGLIWKVSYCQKYVNSPFLIYNNFLIKMFLQDKKVQQMRLGPYVVVAKIEEGSQAIILLGRNKEKFYGLKVYKHGHIGRSCFQKQMEILSCMDDQVVVKPLEIYAFDTTGLNNHIQESIQPFLVMQYYRNGDLRHFINSGNIPIRIRNHIIRNMARCLHYAQVSGVLHRDIKPENFLIGADYSLKLIDFGAGIKIVETEQSLVGTPNYIAPQIYKSRSYSYKSEIFSIGVICFELAFSNKPTFPFKEAKISDSNFLLLKQKMYDRFWSKFPSSNELQPEFKLFLQKILSPNPEERPSARQILQQNFLNNTASDCECTFYFENKKPPSKIPTCIDCFTY